MLQRITVDIDILQVELEWGSHQEEARPNHLLYRSSEPESAPSVCAHSSSEPIQSEMKTQSVLRLWSASAFVCGMKLMQT